jgi:hypothetical protein
MSLPQFVIAMLGFSLAVGVFIFFGSGSILLALCAAAATATVLQFTYFFLVARYIAARKRQAEVETTRVASEEQANSYELSAKSSNQ